MENPITQAQQKIDEKLQAARDLRDDVVDRAEAAKANTIISVQEKPLQTLAIAAAIGFAIGALWQS